MNSSRHGEWTDQLSDYMEGDLEPGARKRLETHLAECVHCRDVLAELRGVVAMARSAEDLEAPSDLWPRVADAIGDDAPVRGEDVIALPTARRRPVTTGVSGPQLVAAAVLLVMLSVGSTWWVATAGVFAGEGTVAEGPPPIVDVLPAGYVPDDLAAQLGALEGILDTTREVLDPATVEILDRNLRTIQRAIDDSAEALASDPGNAFLLEHLQRMYRRKLTYLQDAVRVAEWAG